MDAAALAALDAANRAAWIEFIALLVLSILVVSVCVLIIEGQQPKSRRKR